MAARYSTVSYALRQPGEWILASEEDVVTQDIHPGITFNDVGQIVRTLRLMMYAELKPKCGA